MQQLLCGCPATDVRAAGRLFLRVVWIDQVVDKIQNHLVPGGNEGKLVIQRFGLFLIPPLLTLLVGIKDRGYHQAVHRPRQVDAGHGEQPGIRKYFQQQVVRTHGVFQLLGRVAARLDAPDLAQDASGMLREPGPSDPDRPALPVCFRFSCRAFSHASSTSACSPDITPRIRNQPSRSTSS